MWSSAVVVAGYGDSQPGEMLENNVVNDCVQVYKWLQNRTESPIYIWGHSLGANLATSTVARLDQNANLTGLILEAAFTSLTDELYFHPYVKYLKWLPWFWDTVVKPLQHNGFLFDTTKHIEMVQCPILFLHAKDDEIVPYFMSQALYTASKKRNVSEWVLNDTKLVLFNAKIGLNHYFIYRDSFTFFHILLKAKSDHVLCCEEQNIAVLCQNSLKLLKLRNYASVSVLRWRNIGQTSLDVNTNVIKDVILYKSNNDRFFKMVNFFGIAQFGFWTYLSLTAYQTLKDIPVSQSTESVWWRKINFGENRWRNSLTIISFLIGWGILAVSWLYTLRAVKYLILRKGGQQATIVTYTPLGPNRMFTLDLANVSSTQSRTAATSFIPLKVKGHWFYYMIDMKGEFRNTVLFDHTAGLKRLRRTTNVPGCDYACFYVYGRFLLNI
ncbi:hypothetical protein YQE_03664, partial [Dendroctonus ponderosae]